MSKITGSEPAMPNVAFDKQAIELFGEFANLNFK